MSRAERSLPGWTDLGIVYVERWVDPVGRAWVAPLGTPSPDADPAHRSQWQPDPVEDSDTPES